MQSHLDIESDEAVELAAALTALTGESVTDAVVRALRERLRQARAATPGRPISDDERHRRVDDILERLSRLSAGATEPGSSDHRWLYGEDGLPR